MIRLFAFTTGSGLRLGCERDSRLKDISAAAAAQFGSVALVDLLRAGRLDELVTALEQDKPAAADMPAAFAWLPPLPRPGKIVAMVQNYRKHAAEFGNTAPPAPTWFAKLPSSLTGHEQPIRIPGWVDGRVDHEVELAVVVGKAASSIAEAEALRHVAGYSVLNDVSARRIQKDDREAKLPWTRCKNFDTFTPMGPWLVPARYVPDPQALAISCRVNGETRQQSSTAEMIHPVARQLAEMSRWMTLEPGDVVATGTPEGVNNLKDGDICECEVAGIGLLRNRVSRA